ncbi:ATP-binding protein [Candidatus Amarolinea aalborgensis]|jgi:hypothetical protein|uniref:ATP-binding protein n=1 Tax=Candidatus Amarolinea aalborgensis TaxID=2249329 RepID=UPI003BF9A2DD
MRFFNTAGPVNCEKHYCLSPLERINLTDVLSLISQEKYFVLHAPRQTGKTSALLALRDYLNAEGRYRCLYVNFEVAQGYRERINEGMTALLQEMSGQARLALRDDRADAIVRDLIHLGAPSLSEFLNRWCSGASQPTILFIDEIDALVGDLLITVLRQLRAGYPHRPQAFPQSVILCGVRDVRDYRIHSSQSQEIITGGSAFNIKAVSLRLGDFTQPEVERLLLQHTAETGQAFEADALATVWHLTQGQPWLVNALAYETTFTMRVGRDRSRPITAEMIQEAKENLILRRETHLDQLTDKLKESRVRRVIEPMLQGYELERAVSEDDLRYVADLGLIRRTAFGPQIANPIYGEIIPRQLTFITQLNFESAFQSAWYIRPDGRLDLSKLLAAFQQFFREHSESWVERFDYKEAGPQLLLQAFLQRIVNGGGRVEREYGLGRKRTDLLVLWPLGDDMRQAQRGVIELKVLYKSLEATLAEGVAQTWEYADRCGAQEAHLVIFDRTPGKPWEEKIFRREEPFQERLITVWGM